MYICLNHFESINKKVPILLNKPKSKQHQRKNNKTTSWTPYGASWPRASCVWKRQLLGAPGKYLPINQQPLTSCWLNQPISENDYSQIGMIFFFRNAW